MESRRTRFSILYFVLAFLLLLGLNYMLSEGSTKQIPYSEMKERIAAGQMKEVVVGDEIIRAVVADSLQVEGQPTTWTAIRVDNDD